MTSTGPMTATVIGPVCVSRDRAGQPIRSRTASEAKTIALPSGAPGPG